ncbi:MAG: hypothetical protein AB1847_14760 [bacterium]
MVFGASTESAKNVLGKATQDAQGGRGCNLQETSDSRVDEHDGENEQKNKCKGHGRNSAHTCSGAEKVFVPYATLKSGDRCPACLKGRVYRTKTPKTIVRVTGTAPLSARGWELESLRCNLCGEVFSAQAPPEVGEEKYDETPWLRGAGGSGCNTACCGLTCQAGRWYAANLPALLLPTFFFT